MKKYIFSLMLSFCSILSLSAMSYEEAREQARFLTDKMAYELNLNDQQYNDCYEINLDYLLSVETVDDIYGDYLAYRNADIRHILYDWQYTIFAAADYFFRPLAWLHNRWFFPIYRHYHVGYYYYGYPSVYYTYRGGHGRFYHHNGFYVERRPHWNGGFRGMDRHPMNHHGSVGRGGGRGNGYHIGDGGRGGGRDRGNGYRIGDGGRGGRNDNNFGRGNDNRHDNNIGRGNDNRHDNNIGRGNDNRHDNNIGGRGNSHNDNSSVTRGSNYNSRGYDHPSSTRTTVNSGARSGGYSGGSHSTTTRSSGSFGGGSHSGGSSRGSSGGFGGGSRGGGSHSGGFSGGGSRGGGSRGGGRGR